MLAHLKMTVCTRTPWNIRWQTWRYLYTPIIVTGVTLTIVHVLHVCHVHNHVHHVHHPEIHQHPRLLTNIIGSLKHLVFVFVCVFVFVFVFVSTTSMSITTMFYMSMSISYLKSLNPVLFKNITYIGSLKHFVFVCVSLTSPDDSWHHPLPSSIWYVGSGVILGWYKGPIFEILKWWQTDKQTNRFSTCRLDPRKKSSENTTGGATGQTQYWSHVFEKSFPPQIYKTQENITNSLFGQKNQI